MVNRHGILKYWSDGEPSFEFLLNDQEFTNLFVELIEKMRVLLLIYGGIESHLIGINAVIIYWILQLDWKIEHPYFLRSLSLDQKDCHRPAIFLFLEY